MTPAQLYAMPHERVARSTEYLAGCYFNHLPEAGDKYDGDWAFKDSDRMEVRVIKEFDYDGRRFWRLATVWLDGKPVMVIQNAGREGDDWAERFVTDPELLVELAKHVRSLGTIEMLNPEDRVPQDVDLPALTEFYNQSLDGPFRRYAY